MYGKYSWFLRYNGGTLNIFSFSDGIDENAFKYPKPKTMKSNPPKNNSKLDNSKQDVMYAHHVNSNPIILWLMHYITCITQRIFQSVLYYNVIRFIIQACWYVNHLIFRFDLTWSYYYHFYSPTILRVN